MVLVPSKPNKQDFRFTVFSVFSNSVFYLYRLLMRREPILKICLNHYLTTEMSFAPKDDRSWFWFAPDFAEGQLVNEQFCLRFKTPSIAADFKSAVDIAQVIIIHTLLANS